MPLVYLPVFIKDSDYQVLNWLDKHNGSSRISFNLIDGLNINIYKLEQSILRLEKEEGIKEADTYGGAKVSPRMKAYEDKKDID